jgi:hypothetical protein
MGKEEVNLPLLAYGMILQLKDSKGYTKKLLDLWNSVHESL